MNKQCLLFLPLYTVDLLCACVLPAVQTDLRDFQDIVSNLWWFPLGHGVLAGDKDVKPFCF